MTAFLSNPALAAIDPLELEGRQAKAISDAMAKAKFGADCTDGSCYFHGKIECRQEKGPDKPKDEDFSCSITADPDWQ
jgi:hypothetical protein